MKRNKKSVLILLVIICTVGLIISSQIIKNRGGINVKCKEEYPVSPELVHYRQDNDEWKDYNLGDSKYTMQSSGCVVTCISSAISETNNPLNPEELVLMLNEKKVFDTEGNMQWGKLDEISGFHTTVYSDLNPAYIDQCLSQGKYPIVKVHRKSLFSYHHFVLIVGSENGDYICMDPLKDGFTKLSDYGNRIYSVRCVWYEEEPSLDENNNNESAHKLYEQFLSGDMSVLKESSKERWYIPELTGKREYEYTLLDLDQDGIDELLVQSVDDPGGYNAVFHYEDEEIVCWDSDSMEMICYDYPLQDGLMVNEYDYGGSISYIVFQYLPTGETETVKTFFIREESMYGEPLDEPTYKIDDVEVTKDEFEEILNSDINGKRLDRSAWIKI